MNARSRPPSLLPTLTEVVADPAAQDYALSTSGLRRLDTPPLAVPTAAAVAPGAAADIEIELVTTVPQLAGAVSPVDARADAPGAGPDAGPGPAGEGAEADDQLVRAVLHDLQRHVDLMLEYRLRASLAPLLTQLADQLVRELREELALTLRDVVKRAVNQEVLRRRKR